MTKHGPEFPIDIHSSKMKKGIYGGKRNSCATREISLENKSNVARLDDTGIHDWYRFVFAYSDWIIADLKEEFGISETDLIYDPFNGTGTTTVTSKKLGIDSIGTDASPVGVLAGQVKTNWDIDLDKFRTRRRDLLGVLKPVFMEISKEDETDLSRYEDENSEVDLSKYDFSEPEKLLKGWLSRKPMKKMLVLKHEVENLPDDEVTGLFRLAMIAILPEKVGNIAFGPTLYRTGEVEDIDVYKIYSDKLNKMESDLEETQSKIQGGGITPGKTEVMFADARQAGDAVKQNSALLKEHGGTVDFIITSPPYPNERDYTRTQRLELIWLDEVCDNVDLQNIKKNYLRSNTKNIYVGDNDGERTSIRDFERVDQIVKELEDHVGEDSSGFERYYPRVIEEYFGGMCLHFQSLYDVIAPGGKLAYVVGDQQTYKRVSVETGEILGEIAEAKTGFTQVGFMHWRNRRSTDHDEDLEEEILVLEKPT